MNYVGEKCPFCQNPIEEGEEIVICSSCKKVHHLVCWKANFGCTTYACNGEMLKPEDFEKNSQQEIPEFYTKPTNTGDISINKTGGSQFAGFFDFISRTEEVEVNSDNDSNTNADEEFKYGEIDDKPEKDNNVSGGFEKEEKIKTNYFSEIDKPFDAVGSNIEKHGKEIPQYDGSRFEVLYDSAEEVLQKDSCVLTENVTLIKDHNDGKLYARCTFRSITEKPIKALLINIKAYDIWGTELTGINGYQMLDLKTKFNSVFGQTSPILLTDNNTRKADVIISKVLFEDGIVDVCEEYSLFPEQQKLIDYLGDEKLVNQYVRDTSESSKFVPVSNSSIWRCSCGIINTSNNKICASCRADMGILLSLLDLENLERKSNIFLEEKRIKDEEDRRIAAERAEKARKEQEEKDRIEREEREEKERIQREEKIAKRKKTRKTVLSVVIPLVSLLVIAGVIYGIGWHLIPSIKYKKGLEYYNAGEYTEAYETFDSISWYRNSEEWVIVSNYSYADYLFNLADYENALEILNRFPDYSDSKDKILICENNINFQKGLDKIASEEFSEAIDIFEELGDFSDAKYKVVEAKIGYADQLYTRGDYSKSLDVYTDIKDGKTSSKKQVSLAWSGIYNCHYKIGVELLEEGKYEEAYSHFDIIPINLAGLDLKPYLYQCAENYFKDNNFNQAKSIYNQLNDFLDSKDKYVEATYNAALNSMKAGDYSTAETNFSIVLARDGDYKEVQDKLLETRYLYAKQLISKKEFDKAVTYLENYCKGYKDSDSLVPEAKYNYIINHKSNANSTTYTYLKDLKKIGYKDTADIYKDIYKWKVTLVAVNDDEDDFDKIDNSVSKWGYCHFQFKLSGGPPGEKLTLKHVVIWPDGDKSYSNWYWEDVHNNETFGVHWPDGLDYSGSSGYLTVKVYNKANGELLGEGSVKIK